MDQILSTRNYYILLSGTSFSMRTPECRVSRISRLVRIIIQGVTNVELSTPYSMTRGEDTLHYTYMGTSGRTVVSLYSSKLLTESHIQDFQLVVIAGFLSRMLSFHFDCWGFHIHIVIWWHTEYWYWWLPSSSCTWWPSSTSGWTSLSRCRSEWNSWSVIVSLCMRRCENLLNKCFGPSGVRALPLAAGSNEGGHYIHN